MLPMPQTHPPPQAHPPPRRRGWGHQEAQARPEGEPPAGAQADDLPRIVTPPPAAKAPRTPPAPQPRPTRRPQPEYHPQLQPHQHQPSGQSPSARHPRTAAPPARPRSTRSSPAEGTPHPRPQAGQSPGRPSRPTRPANRPTVPRHRPALRAPQPPARPPAPKPPRPALVQPRPPAPRTASPARTAHPSAGSDAAYAAAPPRAPRAGRRRTARLTRSRGGGSSRATERITRRRLRVDDFAARASGGTAPLMRRRSLHVTPEVAQAPRYRWVVISLFGTASPVPHRFHLRSSQVSGTRQTVSGIGNGRFSIAAAITSGKRSGVQAKAGAPSAASADACSRS